MTNTTKGDGKILLGKHDGQNIYLRAPSWDCGWYWGFGYLGNKSCHYHLDSLMKTTDLYRGMKDHFGDSLIIQDSNELWKFCELMKTAYALKETAEVLAKGGSHYTYNPCADIIKNEAESKRINEIVLPAIFDAVWEIFTKMDKNMRMVAV
jgi:hypothetical protein